MSLLDSLKKKVAPEIITQLVDAVGDDFDWDYVPRTRLNKVISERNTLRDQLSSSTSGEDDDGHTDNNKSTSTPPSTKPGSKTLTQADIDAAVAAERTKIEVERAKEKLQQAVAEKLRDAKVKKPELLLGQLKMDVVKFDDKGQLTGLDDQITAWQTSDPYLFSEVPGSTGTGAGGKGAAQGDLASLQTQYSEALKGGNTATAVALKKQIFAMQQTK